MYFEMVIAFLILLFCVYYVSTKNFNYWKEKNIPHPKPLPIFGNYLQHIFLQKPLPLISQEMCKKFKNEPYFGTFYGTEPALVILDPEVIKLVLKKDFYYFNSRELMDYTKKETFMQTLLFQHGDMWKILRTNLTPLFSSAKLKKMFHLIEKCAFALEDLLDYETKLSDVLKARELAVRFTMDCICSCCFGIEAKTMDKGAVNNVFTKIGNTIIGCSYIRGFSVIARKMWPKLFYGAGLRSFPKQIDDFFNNLIVGVFKSRNYTPTQRHDFIDLLLKLKKNKTIVGDSMCCNGGVSEKVEIELDDHLIVAQCVIFFAAGFETSAGAISLTLYELAKNQEAQKRAQKEIDEYLKNNNNKLSDNNVTELPFLEACMLETLRLYPVLPIITREVVEGYTFPSGLHLERGTRVHLPVYHLHRDPNLFSDPEKYKPERFMSDVKEKNKPYSFFPFGDGPRICIGARFAKLQVFAGLITILKSYSLELASGAPAHLTFEAKTPILQPASSLPIQMIRRPVWESKRLSRDGKGKC